ncbi:MAG: bacillithiol biosynthesis deacetylase BshB1 [Longimicrobiales bacterium]
MTGDVAPIDVLAIAAHPDDAELLCGGALLRCADQGYRTGVLDLTGGETGTWGSADRRATEATEAASVLGLATRRNAGLPDGALVDEPAARLRVAEHVRALRPSTVILHGPGGRHPDHHAARRLGYAACFLAGLKNADITGEPHRPAKLLYALSYGETRVAPRFVVDISDQIDRKLDAIMAYRSQFEGRSWAGDIFGGGDRPLADQIRAHAAHYGSWIRRPYGEPYWTRETMEVEDIVRLGARSL